MSVSHRATPGAARRRSGFTLLEVLIAVAVAGVAAGLVFARHQHVKERAYVSAMKNDLRIYAAQQEVFYEDSSHYAYDPRDLPPWKFSPDVGTAQSFGGPRAWVLVTNHAKTATKCVLGGGDVDQEFRRIVCTPQNQSPHLAVQATPQPVAVGQPVTLTSTGSLDPDGRIAHWTWTFGDGQTGPDAPTTTHAFAAAGTYTVTLRGTDYLDESGEASVTVVVDNRPTAAFTATPAPLVAGRSVVLDAAASQDDEGPLVQYAWTLGDGRTGAGPRLTVPYATPGRYPVTLTVTDAVGSTATVTHDVVVVGNQSPVARIALADSVVNPGVPVVATAATSSDPDGTVAQIDWVFSDSATATGPTASHPFARSGPAVVRVRVTDDLGATAIADAPVRINAGPTATITVDQGTVPTGTPARFTAIAADPEGDRLTYAWTFSDGATAAGPAAAHAAAQPGPLTAQLIVIDAYGLADTATATVTATNRTPTAPVVACTPTTTPTGTDITCRLATPATDPDGGTLVYRWTAVDRTSPEVDTVATYRRATVGTTTVVATADDGQGGTIAAAPVTVTFTNRAPTDVGFTVAPATTTLPTGTPWTLTPRATDPEGEALTFQFETSPTGGAGATWTPLAPATAAPAPQTTARATPGSWLVRLVVTDARGASATSDTVRFTTTNRAPSAPTVRCDAATQPTGTSITCVAAGATDPDGGTLTTAWSTADRVRVAGDTAEFRRAGPGTTTVTASVSDGQGGTSPTAAPVALTFTNRAPTAPVVSCTPASLPSGSVTTCTLATPATDPDQGTLRYLWSDAGRTSAAVGVSATYSLATPATLAVTATADDGQGGTTASAPVSVTFTNRPPTHGTVTFSQNPVSTGDTVTATASGLADPDGQVVAYDWYLGQLDAGGTVSLTSPNPFQYDCCGGSPAPYRVVVGTMPGAPNASSTVRVTYRRPGNYVIGGGARDNDGTPSWAASGGAIANFATLRVDNRAPSTPTITCTQTTAPTGTDLTCTAAATDPDGGTVRYAWSTADRVSAAGAAATFRRATPGTTTITVTATDGQTDAPNGAQSATSAATTLTFTNQAPAPATLTCKPTTIEAGTTVTCTASGATDPDGGQLQYAINVRPPAGGETTVDGTYSAWGATSWVRTPGVPTRGTWTFLPYVRDNQSSAWIAGAPVTVTATNRAPTAPTVSCAASTAPTGTGIACTAAGATDADGDPLTVDFSLTDRVSAAGTQASYARATVGTTTVTATVRDDQGATSPASAPVTLTFTNRAPSAPAVACPATVGEGEVATCGASGATDPEGEAVTYDWSASGRTGTSGAATQTATYQFWSAGTYTVQARALDPRGGASAWTPKTLVVQCVPSGGVAYSQPSGSYQRTADLGNGWTQTETVQTYTDYDSCGNVVGTHEEVIPGATACTVQSTWVTGTNTSTRVEPAWDGGTDRITTTTTTYQDNCGTTWTESTESIEHEAPPVQNQYVYWESPYTEEFEERDGPYYCTNQAQCMTVTYVTITQQDYEDGYWYPSGEYYGTREVGPPRITTYEEYF